ncbi:MAG TPA: histidine phosphatase family protein [Egibacteraceae bacterium]|nr:histidine phosphatase family protein [Egibacteraceae bacterium]
MDCLLLVRHAATAQTRRSRFPSTTGRALHDGCESLDDGGAAQARALRRHLPNADRCWSSLAVRATQTAQLAGFQPSPDAALAECDFGAWAGMDLDEAHAADPVGLAQWHADPDSAPHGGEGLGDVRRRAADVLSRAHALGGVTITFTHGGFVKAALLEILDLPSRSVWRLDIAPTSVTELRAADGTWRVATLNWRPALRGAVAAAG